MKLPIELPIELPIGPVWITSAYTHGSWAGPAWFWLGGGTRVMGGGGGPGGRGPLGGLGKLPTPQASKGPSPGKPRTVSQAKIEHHIQR